MIQIPEETKGLIFDCDGTLADTMPIHFEAWVEMVEVHGLELSEERFYQLGGVPTKKIIEMLAAEAAVQVDAVQLALEKEQNFLKSIHRIEAIKPVADVARQYHTRLPMAVGTGAVKNVGQEILKKIGVYDLFQTVVYAEDTARHKPEPDVFLEAAKRLNIAAELCLVFEDTEPGIEAARRAGMAVIDVRTVHTPRRITLS